MIARPTKGQRQYRAAKVAGNVRRGALLVNRLALQVRPLLPDLEHEVRFHPTRKWRFDLASRAAMVALEVEGGSWVGGAHVRGAHFASDCEKYNTATSLGWAVLRVTPAMIGGPDVVTWVEAILARRGPLPGS